jgi:selenide,water dikinase
LVTTPLPVDLPDDLILCHDIVFTMDQPRLLLAGGGHSHVLVLRQWALRPQSRPASGSVILVSRYPTSLYSGLVPAVVAGLAAPESARIDLKKLCRQAGVRFLQAEITDLEWGRRQLLLQGGERLDFDVLSLDVGAITPAPADGAMAVKPLEPLLAWVNALPAGAPLRLRGGGASAVELALALVRRGHPCRLLLRGPGLALGSRAANRAGERLLAAAGVSLERNGTYQGPADLACTGSQAPPWLAASGLPVDPGNGRVLTQTSLAVVGQRGLFAAGDCGLVGAYPRPAAGVWAVRAAAVLATNLERSLAAPPMADPPVALRCWTPRRHALQLLGDSGAGRPDQIPRALALWGPWVLGPTAWLGELKQRIDRRFMSGFQGWRPPK